MRSFCTIGLFLLLPCLSLSAQERLARPEALKYAFFLTVDLKEMLDTPIPTDPDSKRPVALRLGERGALALPECKLTEQSLKAPAGIVAVGQLWLVKLAPMVQGQPIPAGKLRLVEVKGESGQATAACFALAVRKNAADGLDFLVYGKEKEPVFKAAVKNVPGQSNPDAPLDIMAERNGDTGQLALTLLGKFQARVPVGPAEF